MIDMKKRKKERDRVIKFFSILLFSLIVTYFFPYSSEKVYTMRIGEIPQRDIVAPFTFKIPKTQEEIEKEKEELLKGTSFVLSPLVRPSLDLEVIEAQLENISDATRRNFLIEAKKLYEEIKNYVIIENLDTLRKTNTKFVILLTPEGDKIFSVEKIMSIDKIKNLIKSRANKIFPDNPQLSFLFEELLSPFITPNYRIDFQETELREKRLISKIKEHKGIIYKGEIIAKGGEPLSREDVEKLEAMEKTRKELFLPKLLNFLKRYLLILLVIFFAYFSLRSLFPEIYGDTKMLLIIIYNTLFFLVTAAVIIKVTKNSFYIPFAFISFFFYFICGRKFAVFITFIIAIFTAMYSGMSYFFFLFFLIIGISGILISRHLRNRFDLIFGFFILSLLSLLLISFFKVYSGFDINLGEIVLSSFLSSGFSILGAITLLPFHEKIFGVTTDFILLELSNLDHPLLNMLEEKAPGTFEHSIQISELARIAAERVGANPLLAKVGALFHDIGKIENPKFFIENHKDILQNPHDKISPTVSATILQNHVKKGIELARKYRLPESVTRIIERHHGTLLMAFFYERAKKINPEIPEEEFRYKCPKPERKEEAIIMLLDGIEAKVRSLEKHEFQSISEAIDEVINHRFADGQFDECEITRKDMEKIKEAILPKLIHRFHSRVTYPPLKAKEKIVKS